MFWYNPVIRTMEQVGAPVVDVQAIHMLSGHPNSGQFIEEYRRQRQTDGIVEALQHTGDIFRMIHRRKEPPP
jgi:hypothetical protein